MSGDAVDGKKDDRGRILDDAQDRNLKSSVMGICLRVAAVLLLVAAVVSIPVFFSKKAQVKRSFNRAISAFERKDAEEILEFVSADYSDAWGNTRGTFSAVLAAVYSQFKSLDVQVTSLSIELESPDTAKLTVEGRVIITQNDDTKGYFRPEGPVTLVLKKEYRRWRLSSAGGLNMNIESAFEEVF